MKTLTNLLLLIISLNPEYQAPSLDLHQFSRRAYPLPKRSSPQMLHINNAAYRNIPLVQATNNRPPCSILHQRNHHRRPKDLDPTSPYSRRRVLMHNRRRSLTRHTQFNFHINILSFCLHSVFSHYITKRSEERRVGKEYISR